MARIMTNRSRSKSKRKHRASNHLSHLTDLGASTRGHRIFRDVRSFLPYIVLAFTLQTVAYLSFFTRTAPDWSAALTVVAILALVPIATATTLSAFRRQEAPILVAAAVVAIFFSFAITYISALRIRVSFAGFAAALPLAILVMSIANVKFHRRLFARVAFLTFDGDSLPLTLLSRTNVAVISDPDTDVSQFDSVLIEPNQHHSASWSKLLARCYMAGVDILPWTRFLEISQSRVHVPTFELTDLQYTPSQMLYARGKRLLDIAAVLLTLPITIPLAALTALYVYARDGGPVIFVQHRRGLAGRVFRMYKFRTMFRGTAGGATAKRDKRIIPGCKLIRRLRFDELPQLFNILIGDMSLIGPRPVAEDITRLSIKHNEKYALRSVVLPGITGWAQVTSGYAGTVEEEIDKLSYDLYYIKHLSFDLDLQIIVRTLKTVLLGTGAR